MPNSEFRQHFLSSRAPTPDTRNPTPELTSAEREEALAFLKSPHLVERLAVADDNPAWTAMAIKYPTAAIAVLDFELPWPELHGGAARLIDYQVPRG